MSDPRTTPFNGRVAHVSLKGHLEAERFVTGKTVQVSLGVAALYRDPGGAMDRELLFGEGFCVLDYAKSDDAAYVYGFALRDGYCGYLHGGAIVEPQTPTHVVTVRETYAKATPDLKVADVLTPLFFGALVTSEGVDGAWSRTRRRTSAIDPDAWSHAYLPTAHLRPINAPETDPVDVARRFLGTPYLWGGNSGRGIDRSGLVQAAMHACGWMCPGDSDLQEAMAGRDLVESDPFEPGDLIFWNGHVAMATGTDTMIHANAHHMMVVEEPIAPAIARIAATETGKVTRRLRPERRPWVAPV